MDNMQIVMRLTLSDLASGPLGKFMVQLQALQDIADRVTAKFNGVTEGIGSIGAASTTAATGMKEMAASGSASMQVVGDAAVTTTERVKVASTGMVMKWREATVKMAAASEESAAAASASLLGIAESARIASMAMVSRWQKATAAINATTAEMAASIESRNVFGMTAAETEANYKKVAAAGAAYAASMQTGADASAIWTEEALARNAAMDAAHDSLVAERLATESATTATEANTVAAEANTAAAIEQGVAIKAVGVNSRVTSELGTLMSEAASGNFYRMRRSAAALANQTGILSKLFTGTGLAILSIGGAIAAFTAAAVKGSIAEGQLNDALISTGNYAGVTTGALLRMGDSLAGGAVTIGNARAAVSALAASGRFTGEQMQYMAQAVVDAGVLMNQSIKQSVAEFAKLQERPVQAIEALNQQYHFLTTRILQQIVALQQQGDTIGAADLAMRTYANSLATRTAQAEVQLGDLARGWDWVKREASGAWDAMLGVGRPSTAMAQVAIMKAQLLKLEQVGAVQIDASGGWKVNKGSSYFQQFSWDGGAQTQEAKVQAYIDAYTKMSQTVVQRSKDAALQGVKQEVQAAGTQGVQTLARLGITLDELTTKQQKINQAARALFAIYQAGGKLPAGVYFHGLIADQPQGPGWARIKSLIEHPGGVRAHMSPEERALHTFQGQVGSLSTRTFSTGSRALDAYANGIARLNREMDAYIAKGGPAARAAALFAQGQNALLETFNEGTAKERAVVIARIKTKIDAATGKSNPVDAIRAKYAGYAALLMQAGQPKLAALATQVGDHLANQAGYRQSTGELAKLQRQLAAEEKLIAVRKQTGSITQQQAEQQDIAAQKGIAPQMQKAAEAALKYAEALKDPALIASMEAQIAKIQAMGTQLTDLQKGITQSFQGGIQSFLEQLMRANMTWRNMLAGLSNSILAGINQKVAQSLAQSITGSGQQSGIGQTFLGLFNPGGQQGAPGASSSSSGALFGGLMSGIGSLFSSGSSAFGSAIFSLLGGSFATGSDYVPHDMVAQIHAGERIVPAGTNAKLTEALASGSMGGHTVNLNIHAMDSQSVLGAMDGVKRELAMMLGGASANLNLGG